MSNEYFENGVDAYTDGEAVTDNPYPVSTYAHEQWDRGYWAEHNLSYVEESGGMEEGYGDFSEVEQGRWDDDPNPYHGDYSEM